MNYYNTLKSLGRGTFGIIYLCEKIHNKEKVVVKELTFEEDGQMEAAKNEVKILRSLKHPNVIKCYDSWYLKSTFYIVMEYASGGTLQELIAEERPNNFCPQFVIDIFCQILMGLDHIHERKIIHRDLKTENIFLTGIKGDVVKIGDFGISKRLLNDQKADTIIGTCNYLAPEVCNGNAYNSKSDIWALGCILYELCAMEKMFKGTISNVILSIVNGHKKKVNTKVYGVQMQEFIDMMLDLNPENRPNTKELMADPDIFPSLLSLGSCLGCIDN